MSRGAVLWSEDGWEKDCGQVATTRGWGAFVRWATALPVERFEAVVQIAEYGETNRVGDLGPQLTAALSEHPPVVPTVTSTAARLHEVLRQVPPASPLWLVITVSAGPVRRPRP